MVAPGHSGLWGYQFIEEIVTLCVRAARTDKSTVEVDVVAGDANYAAVRRAVESCPSRITFNKPISVLRSSCNPLDVNVNGRCASDGNIGQFGLHAITDSLPNAADRIHAFVLSDLLDFLPFLGWANWKELSPLFDGKDWVWTNAPPRVVMCWRPSSRISPGPVPRVDKLWSRY